MYQVTLRRIYATIEAEVKQWVVYNLCGYL
jgi:hypothetical protein